MSNFIPLYRAKVQDHKLNLDKIEQFTELIDGKRYAIGLLCGKGRHIEVTKGDTTTFLIIDQSTLAIHFPDMLDSQGNKIFVSLSENGKGGDICEYKDWDSDYEDEFLNKGICLFLEFKVSFTNRYEVQMEEIDFKNDVKVIGIQK